MASAPLSRPLAVSLYGTIGLFYAASVYHHGLASLLWYAKWILLFVVLFIVWKQAQKGHVRFMPSDVAKSAILLFAVSLNIFVSMDIKRSTIVFVSLALAVLSSLFLARYLASHEARRRFFDIVANVGRLVIISSFIMWLAGISLGRGIGRFSAWTDNPNTLALLLAPTLVILLAGIIERRRNWFWRDAAFLLPGLIVLHATNSRASLLWFATSVFAFWVVRRGIGLSTYLGFMALIIIFGWWEEIAMFVLELAQRNTSAMNADVLSGRSEMWQLAIELIPNRLFFGYGLGTSRVLIDEFGWFFREAQGGNFHNSYLNIVVETGLAGFIAFVLIVLRALMHGFVTLPRLRRTYGAAWPSAALPWVLLTGALAHAMFETWLLSAGNANALIFWLCVWFLFVPVQGGHSSIHPANIRVGHA